ncbi:hypothetical protein SSX86_033085 [Deinandra increscens subsp. villosa]|uniref:Uncharacterized protein n=1 Tax=Deinandra increscens subsp. villosa TaxID=3103831 RepID=A0AAP0GG77_9ASTR
MKTVGLESGPSSLINFSPAMSAKYNTAPSGDKWKLSRSGSHRRCAFTRKCARLVKEQRARFYIMRRCVTMLVCWRDYGDS